MVDALKIKAVIEPIWNELETYHEYKYENQLIDSEEPAFSIYLQKEGEDAVMLGRPSLALFHADPALYKQECDRLRTIHFQEVLQTDVFPYNRPNFDELACAIKMNKITPFVGAGASIAAGCSSWPGYLKQKANEYGIGQQIIDEHLQLNKYEHLLELICEDSAWFRDFEFYFQQDFTHANADSSFAWMLPKLFTSCVITTNFDRVLEDCYSQQQSAFTEKTVGLNNPHNFIKAMTRGQRYLLKLHGNIDATEHRVFTKSEYQRAYSQDDQQNIDLAYPLPKLLSQLYINHSFLFLGCSLDSDRTIKTFELICEYNLPGEIADHYAILERPEDDQVFIAQKRRLSACNIKPIWYDCDQHEKVGEILDLLLLQ